jgi:hypothetical protein
MMGSPWIAGLVKVWNKTADRKRLFPRQPVFEAGISDPGGQLDVRINETVTNIF